MPNIKFNYLYRDGANYKNHSSIIFDNPNNIDLLELEVLIRSKLIDGTWFYSNEWKVPDLHFEKWDDEIDHSWHEFESIEYSNEPIAKRFSLDHFMEIIKNTNWGTRHSANEMYIKGVPVIPGDKSIDISDLFGIFTGRELDAAEIRKTAWERKSAQF